MTCDRAMDLVLDASDGRPTPFIDSIRLRFHLNRCASCAAEAARLRSSIEALATAFLPPAPDLTDAIMAAVRFDRAAQAVRAVEENTEEHVSYRNWVFSGSIIFASLALFPLGQASGWLVRLLGSDLTFPIAVTLGAVLTAYCALFIGSHLDELAERFGLHRAG